jgi:hypothetical protein
MTFTDVISYLKTCNLMILPEIALIIKAKLKSAMLSNGQFGTIVMSIHDEIHLTPKILSPFLPISTSKMLIFFRNP